MYSKKCYFLSLDPSKLEESDWMISSFKNTRWERCTLIATKFVEFFEWLFMVIDLEGMKNLLEKNL